MSGEIEREILHILEKAIDREKAAHKLYKRGEEISVNDEMRKVFGLLAAEELKHEKLVHDMYYDYKKKLGLKVMSDKE
jgi:rubrerythrin